MTLRYSMVHGLPLTAPVVMDIPQISFAPPSPPSNQAVAGRNWRHEAAAEFRATLKPPVENKIRRQGNDRCKFDQSHPSIKAFKFMLNRRYEIERVVNTQDNNQMVFERIWKP
ncbi:hypothetical protein PoB_001260300 [Plakobranchus ocellatus]|uniref:Uncharacterized protein n=1 Tax=Plakobranchus ocellatus TaxID=259542 RepID=A0AAV3YUS0_9GAST|nr:hypothetical protein PoB_001260300 [Plakobranchus ocellatus]